MSEKDDEKYLAALLIDHKISKNPAQKLNSFTKIISNAKIVVYELKIKTRFHDNHRPLFSFQTGC